MQTLWDQATVPASLVDPHFRLFDSDQDMDMSSNASVRLMRYLSLYNNSEYIKALTVFVCGNGIRGLEAHFTQTSLLSGYRSGCARHFPLGADERINCVWLRIAFTQFKIMRRPSLVVRNICSL